MEVMVDKSWNLKFERDKVWSLLGARWQERWNWWKWSLSDAHTKLPATINTDFSGPSQYLIVSATCGFYSFFFSLFKWGAILNFLCNNQDREPNKVTINYEIFYVIWFILWGIYIKITMKQYTRNTPVTKTNSI